MDAQPQTVVVKKRGFFSTLVLGVSFLAVTLVVSGSAITMYGMHIFDAKIDEVAQSAMKVGISYEQLIKKIVMLAFARAT